MARVATMGIRITGAEKMSMGYALVDRMENLLAYRPKDPWDANWIYNECVSMNSILHKLNHLTYDAEIAEWKEKYIKD